MLVSASLDGSLMVWDPSTMLPKGPEKEIASKLTIKAHADGVLSMALFQAAIETPDAQPLHLCTTGQLTGNSCTVHCCGLQDTLTTVKLTYRVFASLASV